MENVADIYSLSPVQAGMLYHVVSEPDSHVYHSQFTCRLSGTLNLDSFKAAWELLHTRHPALRSIFLWEEIEDPLQIVREKVSLPWRKEDWSHLAPEDQEEHLRQYLDQDINDPFELTKAPLSRILIVREGSDSWRLAWSFHHLIMDGWSVPVALREVLASYNASRSGTQLALPPAPPFRTFIAWSQEQDQQQVESFWRQQLQGAELPTPIRTIKAAPTKETGFGREEVFLSRDLSTALSRFSQENRITMNTVMHGAWALLLNALGAGDDLVFGSVTSTRPIEVAGSAEMIGCCINTLPLRVCIDLSDGLLKWLAKIQEAGIEIRRHASTSLAAIRSWSALPPGTPLLESIVVFENAPRDIPCEGTNLVISDRDVQEHSNFPLAFLVEPGERIRLIIIRDQSHFTSLQSNGMLARLQHILESFVRDPEQRLGNLDLLLKDEKEKLARWALGPELKSPPELLPTLIEQAFARHGQEPAVIQDERFLTWRGLAQESARLVAALQEAGIRPGETVALCMERSPEMIIGIVGILRAGCAYLPIDPSYPRARLEHMIETTGTRAFVTEQDRPLPVEAPLRLNLDALPDDLPPCSTITPTPADLAYVIFTSGSTGTPKGVGVSHANLAASTAARFHYYREPAERFLLLSSFAFDSSVAGLFWTLACGGTLVLPRDKEEQDLPRLSEVIARHHVTHTLCLPALYNLLLREDPSALSSLKTVIVAGEECPADLCELHHKLLPDCEFHNEYGPTEATVWASVWKSPGTGRDALLGRPIPGASIHLLDVHQRPVPPGVEGELYVEGPGVTSGYLDRLDETAARFVPSPWDSESLLYRTGDLACWTPEGQLSFRGRADGQIKLRGHRVEIGEIEASLHNHPDVGEAAALLTPGISNDVASLAKALSSLDDQEAQNLLAEVTSP